MTPDLNAIHADYEAWQTAHQSFDTDQWHLTADRLAGWVPDLLAEVERLAAELTVVRRERAWLLDGLSRAELEEFRLLAQTAQRAREDAASGTETRECPGQPLTPGVPDDGLHCEHWHDGGSCCRCHAPAEPSAGEVDTP